ncbi:hypothetical protein D4S03_02950 [bacterium]|nr:MAG: hypothetical protein D4S03_02950 [bacterium]
MKSLPVRQNSSGYYPLAQTHAPEDKVIPLVAQLLFIACLLPYFSPIPLYFMDVQPTAFLLSLVALFILARTKRGVRILRSDWLFLALACIFMFYLNPFDERITLIDLRKTVSLASGFAIYLAARNLLSYLSFRILEIAAIVALAFQVLQILLPSVYLDLSTRVLSRAMTTPTRGYNGAFPETSFVGYFAILYLILYALLRTRGDVVPRWRGLLFIGVCLAIMVASLSATALTLAAIMGLVALTMIKRKRILVLFLALTVGAAVVFVTVLPMLPSHFRVVSLVQMALKDPRAILNDASIVNRLNSGLMGGIFPFKYPLGLGILYPEKGALLAIPGIVKLETQFFDPVALAWLFNYYPVSLLMNDFAVTTFRMGWVGVLTLLLFLYLFGRHQFSRLVQCFIIVTILWSFPLSLPPIYLLMALIRQGRLKSNLPPAGQAGSSVS